MELSNLSIDELNQLQYAEEKKYAELIRGCAAFSEERARITAEAYAKAAEFVDERNARSGAVRAYGADALYISFIKSAAEHLRALRGTDGELVFYEAGVGTGYIVRALGEEPGLKIYGCDVYLTEELKKEFPYLHEASLKRSLESLPDDFIDLIYWNDVMEHMPADEIEFLLKLLARKCKPGGLLITITPSAYNGPHDITRLADPSAKVAHGLHLKEYALKDVLNLYKKTGWKPAGRAKGKAIDFSDFERYYTLRVIAEEVIHSRLFAKLFPEKSRRFNYISTTVATPMK